jgi:hypothetical protein
MRGWRRRLNRESEEKMMASLKLCAVRVYVTKASVAARPGTENAAAMLSRAWNAFRSGFVRHSLHRAEVLNLLYASQLVVTDIEDAYIGVDTLADIILLHAFRCTHDSRMGLRT